MKRLAIGLTAAALMLSACGKESGSSDGAMVVGFSLIGSESGWRTA